MRHLTDEALARLVDESPAPAEAAHLRDCLFCRREVEEMREMAGALAELGEMEPPAGAWAALETALRAEGLVRDRPAPVRDTAPTAGVIPLAPRRTKPWYARASALRAAAAAALFLLGGTVSWAVLGRPSPTGPDVAAEDGPARMNPVYADRLERSEGILPAAGSRAVTPLPGEETLIYEAPVPQAVPGARLASNGGAAEVPRTPRRVRTYEPAAPVESFRGAAPVEGEAVLSAAEADLLQAEVAYLAALQRYARAADETEDPQARLAALERLVGATSAALERAPDDGVINGYHMAALRQRDALRRRIAADQQKNWF
jgi:hypothetical protein